MSARITCSISPDEAVAESMDSIRQQLGARSYQASNELRNSALLVLRGQRHGRRYRVPGTKAYYTASAPGEPPAVRTGAFRNSWQPTALQQGDVYISRIESDIPYADWLENGTPGGKMAPRPHHERILKDAEPKVVRIYSAPYD